MTDDLQKLLAGMVKPLDEWEEAYFINEYVSGDYSIDLPAAGWKLSRCGIQIGIYPTLEAAKAAAQADYAARAAEMLNLDAVLALVAAAYADAIAAVREEKDSAAKNLTPDVGCYQDGFSDAIIMIERRSWANRHATAALARMLADARAEGLEMAARWHDDKHLVYMTSKRRDPAKYESQHSLDAAAIRAMKGEQG